MPLHNWTLNRELDLSFALTGRCAPLIPWFRPRYYHPKNPIKTPSHYPQSRPPYMKERSFFHNRLEIDQLFYIFYYCPGTFEQ